MTVRLLLIAGLLVALGAMSVDGQSKQVTLAVVGETNLKSNFIEDLRASAHAEGLAIDVVDRTDPALRYTVIVAQETTIGSAAAAAILLDRAGDVAASVVRSGRLSGRGALNACAKELVKKLAILAR
jgi:hypothetical protein